MSFNKPDVKAPRCRKSRSTVITRSFYNQFRTKNPKFKDVPDHQLRDIICEFNTQLWENVIETRDGVEFPEGLGYLFIGVCPAPKKKNLDIANSIKYGASIKHRNFASDSQLAKIIYTNFATKYKFLHNQIWAFKGVRSFTRTVAKVFPENWASYIKLDSSVHVSNMLKASLNKNYARKKQAEIPDGYNEFILN